MKLQKNFQIFHETFILKFYLFSKFGVISWFTKQITKFVKRVQGRSQKFYEVSNWSFEVSVESFILSFEVSDQSFGKVTARLNRFDCNLNLHTSAE